MNLNDYQDKAMSFRLPSATDAYALLNLVGEMGELFSLLAKAARDGKKEDFLINYKKEMGDMLWSLAAMAQDQGWTLEEVAQANIDKLQSRSDRGKLQGSGDNR